MRETAEERAARYLREGRTVSGGKQDNPPDRYGIVPLTGNAPNDLVSINALADQGYRFVAVVEDLNSPFVLMGNYKENK